MAVFLLSVTLTGAGGGLLTLTGCTINPATGESQFAALMSPQEEARIGAKEHPEIMKTFGGPIENSRLEHYVAQIGQRVAANAERKDVQYQFHVIDTAMVNAFALPGGYIYVSRGLLALANSEAEVAGVLAHEVGHIAARHSAERYSHGVLTSLGAAVLAASVNADGVGEVADLGSNLYIKSYSRKQESEADALGIRYMSRAGYDPAAMISFLETLERNSKFEDALAGRTGNAPAFNYFSTHPQTESRIIEARKEAEKYAVAQGLTRHSEYLAMIDGLIYGQSAREGLVRGQHFYHPGMNFTFEAPAGYRIQNEPTQIVASDDKGGVLILDIDGNPQKLDPVAYLAQSWMRGELVKTPEAIEVNGMKAATAAFPGTVNGKVMTIRVIAVQWSPDRFFRFQIGIPRDASVAAVDALKRATYSLRPLSAHEKATIKPYKVRVISAEPGDSVASLAARMPFNDGLNEQRFRVLNGLTGDIQRDMLLKTVQE